MNRDYARYACLNLNLPSDFPCHTLDCSIECFNEICELHVNNSTDYAGGCSYQSSHASRLDSVLETLPTRRARRYLAGSPRSFSSNAELQAIHSPKCLLHIVLLLLLPLTSMKSSSGSFSFVFSSTFASPCLVTLHILCHVLSSSCKSDLSCSVVHSAAELLAPRAEKVN